MLFGALPSVILIIMFINTIPYIETELTQQHKKITRINCSAKFLAIIAVCTLLYFEITND